MIMGCRQIETLSQRIIDARLKFELLSALPAAPTLLLTYTKIANIFIVGDAGDSPNKPNFICGPIKRIQTWLGDTVPIK